MLAALACIVMLGSTTTCNGVWKSPVKLALLAWTKMLQQHIISQYTGRNCFSALAVTCVTSFCYFFTGKSAHNTLPDHCLCCVMQHRVLHGPHASCRGSCSGPCKAHCRAGGQWLQPSQPHAQELLCAPCSRSAAVQGCTDRGTSTGHGSRPAGLPYGEAGEAAGPLTGVALADGVHWQTPKPAVLIRRDCAAWCMCASLHAN